MKRLVWLALAAGIAVFADQLDHRAALDRLIREVDTDPGAAAERLLHQEHGRKCSGIAKGETGNLARALFIVETVATSRTEHILEWMIAFTTETAGVVPPDLSYGPGQIRPSALVKTSPALPQSQRSAALQAAEHPARLFDKCHALLLADIMIRSGLNARTASSGLLTRADVTRIAAQWNGQQTSTDAEAAIAAARYQQLVYEIFLHLRFSQPRDRKATHLHRILKRR